MAASSSRQPPDSSSRPDPLTLKHIATAWHPLFYLVLEEFLPVHLFFIFFEWLLNKEPSRLDVVVVRRFNKDMKWRPSFLRSFLACLGPEDTLIEFKGPNHSVRAIDLDHFLAKAYLYKVEAFKKGEKPRIDLAMVFNKLTPSLVRGIEEGGGRLVAMEGMRGLHRVEGLAFPLVLMETSLVWKRKGEYLLGVFAKSALERVLKRFEELSPKEQRLLTKLMLGIEVLTERRDAMAIQDMEKVREQGMKVHEMMALIMQKMSPEERQQILAPLPPEERLRGLSPKEILEQLSPDDIAKALPLEVLKKIRKDEH